ncbi:MAG: alpha/beta hydrolase family protein [Candidatus Bipolaricaulia bacterium]
MIEKEVTVNSGDVRLAGTLSLPSEEGSFPCVLMIHGSGPVDRDENVRQLKLFKVKLNVFNTIAHYLAAKGIASLRYDKRGSGQRSAG